MPKEVKQKCTIPTYRKKSEAKQHGAITYGAESYLVRKVKGGYRAYKK